MTLKHALIACLVWAACMAGVGYFGTGKLLQAFAEKAHSVSMRSRYCMFFIAVTIVDLWSFHASR
jgi:hypothetical protein